jgi:hypothetical protein
MIEEEKQNGVNKNGKSRRKEKKRPIARLFNRIILCNNV